METSRAETSQAAFALKQSPITMETSHAETSQAAFALKQSPITMETSRAETSQAAFALKQSPIPILRKLKVEETDSEVVISGIVPSYYFKQLAQETIMPVLDRRELHNRVKVERG